MERRNFLKQTIVTAAGSILLPAISKASNLWEELPPVVIDGKVPGRAFTHLWSKSVGGGRASESMRGSWLEQLQFAKKNCGFEYCRVNGLFQDDMSVSQGPGSFNWQSIDDLLDKMLKTGVKPFVNLSYFPKEMAGGTTTQFWWKAYTTPQIGRAHV